MKNKTRVSNREYNEAIEYGFHDFPFILEDTKTDQVFMVGSLKYVCFQKFIDDDEIAFLVFGSSFLYYGNAVAFFAEYNLWK